MRRMVLLVVVLAGLLPASAQAWTWPVSGKVLRPFVFGSDPYAGGQHRGIDVTGDLGADVIAPASGRVSFAGTVPKGGRTLSIRTPDGYTVTLQHLGSFRVRKGDAVTEGAPVATVGTSGEPDWPEPYVYLGIRVTADEQGYVDPLTLLPALPAPDPAVRPPSGGGAEPPPPPSAPPAPPAAAHPHSPAPAPSAPPAQPAQPAQPEPVAPVADPSAAPAPVPPQPATAPATAPPSLPVGATESSDGPGFATAEPVRPEAPHAVVPRQRPAPAPRVVDSAAQATSPQPRRAASVSSAGTRPALRAHAVPAPGVGDLLRASRVEPPVATQVASPVVRPAPARAQNGRHEAPFPAGAVGLALLSSLAAIALIAWSRRRRGTAAYDFRRCGSTRRRRSTT